MKQLTGSGRRNPMVQRLQRYTAMPAIFRAVDTPVMPAAVPDGSLEPVVKTFILPPHTFAAPPAELVSAPETAVSPEAAVQTADAPQQFPVPTDQPTPPPIQRAAQPTPTPPTAVPTSPPVPTSKPTEQSAWSRLKAAAKQVQRAVTGEPSSPPPAPTPAEMKTAVSQPAAAIPQPPTSPPAWAASPADSAPLMEAAAGVQREPASPGAAAPPPLTLIPIETDAPPAQPGAAPDRPHTPAERQDFASPSPQPAPPAAGADADPISRRLDQIMRKHREAGTIETPPEMAARSQTTAVPPTPPPTVETPVETHNLASPSPQPTPPAAGADADPISRRLDQIMRKHREAGTIETPPEMAARSQTTAVPPTPPPAVETPAETHNLASPSPQPTPPAAGADADPISRRLDQIMRKHREAGTIETPPEMAARSQTTAVPPTPPPTVETPVETHNLASPSPQPTPPAAGADADPISRRLDQIMRKHREAGTIETPPEMVARSQTTAVPPTPPPTVETPAERQDFASPSPQPAPPAPAPIMREPQEVDGLETPSETAAMQPETAVSHSPLSNPQPAGPPLQAAWPVQIVETPGPLPPPFTPSSGPLMRQTAPAETAKVRQQLDGIPPGQPSDSSVQFIRPRKPRPQPAAPKTEAIQRQESLVPDGAEVAVPPSPSPATPPPPAKVATEIGELPGDLWRLIGQEPPKTAGSGTAVTNTAPPTTLMQPDAPPSATIQRAEAEPAPAEELAPAPEAPPASPREGGETGQAAEVDVDELARQVYGELKERMSIEWERTRGRF